MNDKINDGRVNESNERKGRGLFYIVVAVSTLIVTMIGATFAYFAATSSSANNAIMTNSASVSVSLLSYESAWSKGELIPVDTDIVKYAFANQDDTTGTLGDVCYNESDEKVDCASPDSKEEKKKQEFVKNSMCLDDYGNPVCSVYVFQVVNDSESSQNLTFNVISNVNTFSNLYAGVYEVSVNDNGVYEGKDSNNGHDDPSELTVKNGDSVLEPGQYTPVYINRKGVKKELLSYTPSGLEKGDAIDKELKETADGSEEIGLRTTAVANNVNIGADETKTFALILYIHNLELAQPEDENSKFQGSINVTTGDGTAGVSGYIGTVVSERD